MQPESLATTPPAIIEDPAQQPTPPPSQHGPPAHGQPGSLLPADDAGTGTATSTSEEQLARDAAFAASLQESSEKPSASNRLNTPPGTPSPPVLNRITEYEQASTPPVKKREGPEFAVIKKQRSPGDKRSPIQELPNGRWHTASMWKMDYANM